jgi:hypothetical protein
MRIRTVLLFLIGTIVVSAQPLTLRARASKTRTLAGESIAIQIDQSVSADFDMETVELNRNRTRVSITPAGSAVSRTLSGSDYVQLHHAEGIVQLGDAFRAPAGRKWTTELNLFDYTRPLGPGRYRVEIAYQYGNSVREVIRANSVEIEVLAAQVTSASFRRFGLGAQGEVQRGLWSATAPDGSKHWFFQESAAYDPGVTIFAVDIGSDLGGGARLAQLNDIPGMQFANYAVWTSGSQICWLAVHRGGRSGNAACADAGLGGAAVLADPALQKRQGGLVAIVSGKDAASIVTVSAEGKASYRVVGIPEPPQAACVGWVGEGESPMLFYASASGKVRLADLASKGVKQLAADGGGGVELAADQWMGSGRYWLFQQRGGSLHARSWSLDGRKQTSDETIRVGSLRGHPQITTFGPDSAEFALWFEGVLVTRAGEKAGGQRQAPLLGLTGSGSGIFAFENGGGAGLRVSRLDAH